MGLIDFRHGLLIANSFDDLIHELTHMICGPHHDKEFSEIYYELGGNNKITYDSLLDKLLLKFGIAGNVGNVTGIQNILLDYHLLLAYRKFSQRVLGTEGQWEVLGNNRIKLFPTPRGTFPVMVEYLPKITYFRSPMAKEITKRMMVAEAKIMLGNIRSKFAGLPAPDGGTLSMNGEALRTEGQTEKDKCLEDAIKLGEPLPILLW